jgi:hypothetical protein
LLVEWFVEFEAAGVVFGPFRYVLEEEKKEAVQKSWMAS